MKKNDEKKIGAVIYVRVSSDEQVKGTSLNDQEARCRAYCASEKLEVLRVFREEGASAKTADRKVLLESIEFCRKHKKEIAAYVVWKVDRLARNTNDHFTITKTLIDYRIRLCSVTESIDGSPIGKFMETILAGSSEFDNAIRTQRCTGGMLARLRNGIWPWKPTVGYICAQNKKHGVGKTEPDKSNPKVFHIIQRILKAYARETMTQSEMVRELEKENFETITGIKPCTRFVEEIITERLPFYAGLLKNPWPEKEDGSDRLLPGKHEPMITVDEMSAIQVIRKGGKHVLIAHNRYNPEFPLRRLVLCATCRDPLTGSAPRGRNRYHFYYHCFNKVCPMRHKSIKKEVVEPAYMVLLEKVTPDTRFLDYFGQTCIAYWSEQRDTAKTGTNEHQKALKDLEARRANIFAMREQGDYTQLQFRERMEEVDRCIAETKVAMNRLPTVEFNMEEEVAAAKTLIGRIVDHWDELSPETRQRFQKLAFPKGIPYSRETGFGTVEMGRIFTMNQTFQTGLKTLVDLGGFEPPTSSMRMTRSTN